MNHDERRQVDESNRQWSQLVEKEFQARMALLQRYDNMLAEKNEIIGQLTWRASVAETACQSVCAACGQQSGPNGATADMYQQLATEHAKMKAELAKTLVECDRLRQQATCLYGGRSIGQAVMNSLDRDIKARRESGMDLCRDEVRILRNLLDGAAKSLSEGMPAAVVAARIALLAKSIPTVTEEAIRKREAERKVREVCDA